MRRSLRALFPALAALAVTPVLAAAQTCLGAPAFASNHLQLSGDYTFTKDVDELGAAFVSGSNSVFAGLGVSSYTLDGADANIRIGGVLGYQVPVSERGRVQACPLLRASYGLPTNNYDGVGGDLTTQSYGLGLAIGGELMRSGRLALVPAVQASVQREVFTVSGGLAPVDASETFVRLGATLGIVLNDALALRPSVSLPINAASDEPVYGLGLSLNYGGRR